MNRFDVITLVDLPAGVAIMCHPALQTAILCGRIRGEVVKEGDQYILQARRVTTGCDDEIGPTRTYPSGKLTPTDQGGLNVGVAVDEQHGVIVIDFGTPVLDISMRPEEATEFADALISKANELDKLKGKEANGT